jgi:hypothetical protein
MIELAEVQDRIKSRALDEPLIDAHRAAAAHWKYMVEERPELVLPLDATARANFIQPHICHEIAKRVDGIIDGVKSTDALGFFAVRVDDDMLLRFKYVGLGRPSNVQTEQQKLLAQQSYTAEMVMALTGDPSFIPPTVLTVGYTLDGPDIARIEVRRDCRGHLPWSFDIYGGAAVIEPIVMPGLDDMAKPATVTSTRRVAVPEVEADQA